jgi:hypothetical protein
MNFSLSEEYLKSNYNDFPLLATLFSVLLTHCFLPFFFSGFFRLLKKKKNAGLYWAGENQVNTANLDVTTFHDTKIVHY